MGRRIKRIRKLKNIYKAHSRDAIFHFCDSSVIMTIMRLLKCRISLGFISEKKQNMREKTHLKRHFLQMNLWLFCSKPAANKWIWGVQTCPPVLGKMSDLGGSPKSLFIPFCPKQMQLFSTYSQVILFE